MSPGPTRSALPSPRSRRRAPGAPTRDACEMTNLSPRTTGLPLTVWAGPRGHAQHDAYLSCLAKGAMS